MSEFENYKPVNTGLADKIKRQLEEEKAKLRALLPSAANSVAANSEASILNETIKKPNTGLQQTLEEKKKAEKEKLRALMPSAINEDSRYPSGMETRTDNDEHEPNPKNDFHWAPVTPQEIKALYPCTTAISDIKMVLNTARQQPEMAVALIGERGTKYLIKTDKLGQFYMTKPSNDPQQFTNPGANTDYDADDLDDKNASTQMQPFNRRAMFEDAFVIYEDIEKKFDKSSIIKEDLKKVSKKKLNESSQKTVNINELNTLLYDVQKELREKDNESLEKLADSISEAIAETIISGKKAYNYDKYCLLVNKFNESFGD